MVALVFLICILVWFFYLGGVRVREMKEPTPPVSSHLVCLTWGFVLPETCAPVIHQCYKCFYNHFSYHLLLSLWYLLKKAEDIAASVLFVLSTSWQGCGEKVPWDFCI